jgi:NitT/TauT family transport system substrate-binding protein
MYLLISRIRLTLHEKLRFTGLRLKWQRFVTIALVALLACGLLTSCIRDPLPPLRVGAGIWTGYESLYLARSLGYYDVKSLRLVDYPNNSEIMRAFRNHDLDVATLTTYEALVLAETMSKIKIILVMDSSNGADVILGQPELTDLQAIQSKRVGVESGALGAFMLTRALEQANIDTKAVDVVSLGASEHENAFQKKDIDAVVTYEPNRSKLLAIGANMLFDSSKIPNEILDILVVHEELLESRPEALQSLVQGHFNALSYLAKNPDDGARRVAPREGVTVEQFLDALKGISLPNATENQKLLSLGNQEVLQRVERVSEFMHKTNLLRSSVSLTSLFSDRFVRDVQVRDVQVRDVQAK